MSAQMMQKIAPGWRRVATPRYKKDYMGKHVTAADFSRARCGNLTSPPDGAVCLVERRYSEGAGQEFHLLLEWRCPHCGMGLGRLDKKTRCPYCDSALYEEDL